MKLNRKWIMVLALVMSMAMATTGTLAYLTDRDSEANVFTMGNVEIDLNEEFDPEDAELIPGLDIEKKPTITNTGKNEAWVWATIAIPAALDNDDASKNIVHFNFTKESIAGDQWNWKDANGNYRVKNEMIDGVEYKVYTALYETALEPGDTTTEPVITKVYMDKHIDIDTKGDVYHVEGGVVTGPYWNINDNGQPVIYVSAYAIQTKGFDTVQDGYDAYNAQWGNKGAEYGDADDLIDKPVTYTEVANAAELEAAIGAGESVKLMDDVDMGGTTLTVEGASIDLNGKILSSSARNGTLYLKEGASVTNGTVKHNGTVAAIKVWGADVIEDVEIELAGKSSSNNVITGISVQKGSDTYLKLIKNVTLTSTGENKTYNGIETYLCGDRDADDYAIGRMENVTVNVNGTALLLSAPAGKATNCEFAGDVLGIDMHLKGTYNVSLELDDCEVSSIRVYDEAAYTNPGKLTLVYDADTTITGGIDDTGVVETSKVTITKK